MQIRDVVKSYKKRGQTLGESGLLPLNVTGGSVAAAIPVGAVLKEAARESGTLMQLGVSRRLQKLVTSQAALQVRIFRPRPIAAWKLLAVVRGAVYLAL